MAFLGAHVARVRLEKPHRIIVPLYVPSHPSASPGGGGGGTRDVRPASRGQLPPPRVARVFIPPALDTPHPKLPLAPSLVDAPVLPVTFEHYGVPKGVSGPLSGGPGWNGGLGDGHNGGVGPGDGLGVGPGDHGFGGPRGSKDRVRLSRLPRLLYKIEPEYPDEARRARREGTVLLGVEIDESGRTRVLRVVKGLGLGMDERAIEAVRQWRFSPALDGSRAVASPALIEVSFRLL